MNGASDSLVPRKGIGIKNDIYCTPTIQSMHVFTQRIPYSNNYVHSTTIPLTSICSGFYRSIHINLRLILKVSK